MNNKLAIFDLDGTLFDTKSVNYEAYRKALELAGVVSRFDYDFYCEYCNGRYYKDFLPEIAPSITVEQMEEVHELKGKLYPNYLTLARKNDHLFCMIDLLKRDYMIALVTTASRRNVMNILEKFGGKELFDYIFTQEDVTKKKPDPECFFVAMREANANSSTTIIFEDSMTGLEAAKRSGASYVQVYGYN